MNASALRDRSAWAPTDLPSTEEGLRSPTEGGPHCIRVPLELGLPEAIPVGAPMGGPVGFRHLNVRPKRAPFLESIPRRRRPARQVVHDHIVVREVPVGRLCLHLAPAEGKGSLMEEIVDVTPRVPGGLQTFLWRVG